MRSSAEIRALLPYMTDEERAALTAVLADDGLLWRPLPGPQLLAYHSEADILGYGGAAGGGKTDLIAGLALTAHRRTVIVRREKAQTLGVVQRMTEIIGSTDGYSQINGWRHDGRLIEFAGLDNPGDERRWQGRAHDLKAFDEVTEMREDQVRFVMGWNRTSDPKLRPRVLMTFNPPTTLEGRWVIDFFAPWLDPLHPNPAEYGELRWFTTVAGRDIEVASNQPFIVDGDGRRVYDFDPRRYTPEQIIKPRSRTFIPARVTDNDYYMATGYMGTLQAMPEPLRSQMLFGDFQAGVQDDAFQVIPTRWVEAAMARWKPRDVKPEMEATGVDVARGGKDNTVIARRHAGWWFDELLLHPGITTPDGPTVAALTIAATREQAPAHVDVIGIGASAYDFLVTAKQQAIAVNVSQATKAADKSGVLSFANVRSWLWWRMRELLDPNANNGIALPDDRELKAELCAPRWSVKGRVLQVESREEIIERVGRSPDRATAVILASIETPKRAVLEALGGNIERRVAHHDPYSAMPQAGTREGNVRGYNPYD